MSRAIHLGTRGSLLAGKQSEIVLDRLLAASGDTDAILQVISTKGDVQQNLPLHRLGTTGIFVKEIEQALQSGEIDLAVHSLKDMPAEIPDGLTIAGVLDRGDPRDALISPYGSLADLPDMAIVGTSSLRRRSQLLHFNPKLRVRDIRGNVDTRLRKLDEGEYDAIVVASCGIDRLGLSKRITERIEPSTLLPAACQGIIAIETRADDHEMIELVRNVSDEETMLQAKAERAFIDAIGGGCRIPMGCLSVRDGNSMQIHGMIGSVDGKTVILRSRSGPVESCAKLAQALASELLEQGGATILREINSV